MNGLDIEGKKLIVQLASVGAKNADNQALSQLLSGGVGNESVLTEGEVPTKEMILNMSIPAFTILSHLTRDPNDLAQKPTRVVVLYNMASDKDLCDQEFYEDLLDDVRVKAARFGTALSIVITRPEPKRVYFHIPPDTRMNPEAIAEVLKDQERALDKDAIDPKRAYVPKVLIEFENVEMAQQAAIAIGGLKYDNRTIMAGFYDEDLFHKGEY